MLSIACTSRIEICSQFLFLPTDEEEEEEEEEEDSPPDLLADLDGTNAPSHSTLLENTATGGTATLHQSEESRHTSGTAASVANVTTSLSGRAIECNEDRMNERFVLQFLL